MEPYEWTNAAGLGVEDEAFTGGAVDLSRSRKAEAAFWAACPKGAAIKEVEFTRYPGRRVFGAYGLTPDPSIEAKRAERLHQPYYVTGRAERDRLLVAADDVTVRSRRRRVRAARTVVSGSPSSCVQRSMLCARAASTVQALLA